MLKMFLYVLLYSWLYENRMKKSLNCWPYIKSSMKRGGQTPPTPPFKDGSDRNRLVYVLLVIHCIWSLIVYLIDKLIMINTTHFLYSIIPSTRKNNKYHFKFANDQIRTMWSVRLIDFSYNFFFSTHCHFII